MRKILFVLFALLVISSCKKDEEMVLDYGYNFSPFSVGRYVIYEVDSLVKDDPIGIDTLYKFQLKEIAAAEFIDNEGRKTLRLERYKRFYNPNKPYDSLPWKLTDVWMENINERLLERTEENLKFHKMVFPVKSGKKWNGNAANTLPYQEYIYGDDPHAETINSNNFDSVITVIQVSDDNLVKTNKSSEKFAKNVGLVYKEVILLDKQPSFPGQLPPFGDTVVSANYTMKVISYGK